MQPKVGDENFLPFYHNLNRSLFHFEYLTICWDLNSPICHTTVVTKSCCVSQSLCFIYLLVFLHVVVLSLTLYCTQSTTMVLARSHGLLPPASCFMVNKQGKAWLKTGPDDPLEGSSSYTNFTLNWKGNVCWENVPWHNTVMWGKKKKHVMQPLFHTANIKDFYWLARV